MDKFIPISHLNASSRDWSILARITQKSDIREWVNDRGSWKLFSIELCDENGSEIRATFFNSVASKFFDLLQKDSWYGFSNGKLKPADKRLSSVAHDFQITFDVNSVITPHDAPQINHPYHNEDKDMKNENEEQPTKRSKSELTSEFEQAILNSSKKDVEREKALETALNTLRKQRDRYLSDESNTTNSQKQKESRPEPSGFGNVPSMGMGLHEISLDDDFSFEKEEAFLNAHFSHITVNDDDKGLDNIGSNGQVAPDDVENDFDKLGVRTLNVTTNNNDYTNKTKMSDLSNGISMDMGNNIEKDIMFDDNDDNNDNNIESAESMTNRLFSQALDLKERSDGQEQQQQQQQQHQQHKDVEPNSSQLITESDVVSKKELFTKDVHVGIGDDLYRRAQLREQRLRQRQEIAANQAKSKAQPHLNKKSLEMAEKLETSAMERLINHQKREVIIEDDIMSQSTFTPQINQVSKDICASKCNALPSHERLYNQSKSLRERKERLHESRIDLEMEGCTFNPNTKSSSKTFKNTSGSVNLRSNVVSRLQDWGKRREERIEKEQSMKVDKNEIECTFKPQLETAKATPIKSQKSMKHVERDLHPGISKFIERQQAARQLKKEKENIPFCTGKKWTGRITKGVAPKFNNRPSTAKIKSLRRPVALEKSPASVRSATPTVRSHIEPRRGVTAPPPTMDEIEQIVFAKLEEHLQVKRTVLHDIFHEFDHTRKGYLTREEYGLLMCRLNVDVVIENNVEPFIEYLQKISPDGRITYHYLVSQLREHRARVIKQQRQQPRPKWPPTSKNGSTPVHMRDLLVNEVQKIVNDDDDDYLMDELDITSGHNNNELIFTPSREEMIKTPTRTHSKTHTSSRWNRSPSVASPVPSVSSFNDMKNNNNQNLGNQLSHSRSNMNNHNHLHRQPHSQLHSNINSVASITNQRQSISKNSRSISHHNKKAVQQEKSVSAHLNRMKKVRQHKEQEERRRMGFMYS